MWTIFSEVGKSCVGCGACENTCSTGALHMVQDEEGFAYPSITKGKCTKCMSCFLRCTQNNQQTYEATHDPLAFSFMAKDEKLRMTSSSGGVFSLLAEKVIEDGGVVFGAAFDKQWLVQHIKVETKEDLIKLRGAKYVQSRIENTYSQAKEQLEEGKRVLFSGTPCQVSGLQAFLQKNYKNLLCVDMVCHGVPSPLVWEEYLKEMNKDEIIGVNFRYKKPGWSRYRYSLQLTYKDGTEITQTIKENPFLNGYKHNLFLRPSCGNCNYKYISRKSDITLGDFWGIWNYDPKMDDDKGTSLVLVHTQKGEHELERIIDGVKFDDADVELAIRDNPSAYLSSKPHENRNRFFEKIKESSVSEAVSEMTKESLGKKVWEKGRGFFDHFI